MTKLPPTWSASRFPSSTSQFYQLKRFRWRRLFPDRREWEYIGGYKSLFSWHWRRSGKKRKKSLSILFWVVCFQSPSRFLILCRVFKPYIFRSLLGQPESWQTFRVWTKDVDETRWNLCGLLSFIWSSFGVKGQKEVCFLCSPDGSPNMVSASAAW